MFWLIPSTKTENNIHQKTWTINIGSTSWQRSNASWGFPLNLNPRPRPRPMLFFASTAALASRSCWTTESAPCSAAKCSGIEPREPPPEATPQGETLWENFGHLKLVQVLETLSSLDLWEIVILCMLLNGALGRGVKWAGTVVFSKKTFFCRIKCFVSCRKREPLFFF